MALTKCEDCGGTISTLAESCPHCGAIQEDDYEAQTEDTFFPAASEYPPSLSEIPQPEQKTKYEKLATWLAVIGIAFLIWNYYIKQGDDHKKTDRITEEQAADLRQSMDALVNDPRKLRYLECIGVDPWEKKPGGWTPPTQNECDALDAQLGADAGVGKTNQWSQAEQQAEQQPAPVNPLQDLENRVAQNPNDTDSLLALARIHARMGNYHQAASEFNTLTKLLPEQADLWVEFADMLAMDRGEVLAGQPTMLINKALALDPNNLKANAMAGMAAMERGDYAESVKYWEKLQAMILPGQNVKIIDDNLQKARDALARQNSSAARQDSSAKIAPPVSEPPVSYSTTTYPTSFDCAKAQSVSENLICHDPDLSQSDRALSELYQQAQAVVTDRARFDRQTLGEWRYRENTCKDKECLTRWYEYRQQQLRDVIQKSTGATAAPASPPVTPLVSNSSGNTNAPSNYWYYCRASNAYYPYIQECPSGWEQVEAKGGGR